MRVRPPARRGYVLFAVLLVTVVLSLTAYRFTDGMSTEYAVARRNTDAIQARANAVSGVHYAAGYLAAADLALGVDVSDNSSAFAGQAVGTGGRHRFSLVNVSEAPDGSGSGDTRYPQRFGMSDEGGKINLNAIMQKDPSGATLKLILMALPLPPDYPYTSGAVSDSIIDWLDADSSPRPEGAEDDYYGGMQTPYRCKNGPINSLEELLLVQGITPQLLFGNDRNRNGKLDPSEDDGQELSRGWSEYLTCYGRELNVDGGGATRLNLNGTDLKALSEQLTALVGQEVSDYIIYYRTSNRGVAATPTLPANQVAAPASQLRDLVQAAVDAPAGNPRRINSVITVWNTQITLPRPQAQPGMPPPPTPVVACPLNDTAALAKALPILLEKCTVEDASSGSNGYEITPRININTAPATVLRALVGIAQQGGANVTEEDLNGFVTARTGQNLSDPAVYTGAWLVTQAGMNPALFRQLEPYIGGRSWTYRVHSVGYIGAAEGQTGPSRGPAARVEAVIDAAGRAADGSFDGLPRIVYFRDLTDLGRGFTDLP